MSLTTNPYWSWIQPGQNGKTDEEWGGVGTESRWILGLTLSQKCCWEERWRERLERLCYSIPHSCPGNSGTAEPVCWILHMKGEGDGEKVLPFKGPRWQRNSEKAHGIRESKHRGLPRQLYGLFKAKSVPPFYAVQDPSHGTVIFPPQLTQCTSPLGEQQMVLTAKPIPIFNS